jgi:tetratricopeptide (TPR) repeat protein
MSDASDYKKEFVELYYDAGAAQVDTTPPAAVGDLAALATLFRRDGRPAEAVDCLDAALATVRAGRVPAGSAAKAAVDPRRVIAPETHGDDDSWWSPRRRADIGGPPRSSSRPVPNPSVSAPDDADDTVQLTRLLESRARILRRLGRHDEAGASWEEAAAVAGAGGTAAWIEVAKVREHALRDHAGALLAADRAAALLARRRAAHRPDPVTEASLARRRARLLQRLARAAAVRDESAGALARRRAQDAQRTAST